MYYLSTGDKMNHLLLSSFFAGFGRTATASRGGIFTKFSSCRDWGFTAGGLDHRSVFDAQNRGMAILRQWKKTPMFCPRKVGCLERRWSCAWTSDWRKQWSMHKWLLP